MLKGLGAVVFGKLVTYLLVGSFVHLSTSPSSAQPVDADVSELQEIPSSPLDLNEEVRAWAQQVAAQSSGSPKRRLEKIRQAIVDPRGLGLREIPGPTPTALEAFQGRRANCVGFALLFVAVAREAGIPAFFAAVRDRRSSKPEDGLRLVEEHLTAAARIGDVVWLVDFSGLSDGRRTEYRALADIGAMAIYFSNRGVEQLLDGDPQQAVLALERAVELDPRWVDSWINLGVARRWAERWRSAELAYRRALELDPSSVTAAKNLAVLLDLDGRPEEAAAVRRANGPMQQSDPFALLRQAEQRLTSGELDEARRLYARALEVSAR